MHFNIYVDFHRSADVITRMSKSWKVAKMGLLLEEVLRACCAHQSDC